MSKFRGLKLIMKLQSSRQFGGDAKIGRYMEGTEEAP